MRTRYKIDDYQATYFVIDSFDQLFELTAPDFAPLYEAVRSMGELAPGATIASDSRITLG
jgi:phenylalanine-4-hydroxylase